MGRIQAGVTTYGSAISLNGSSQYASRALISSQVTNISIAAWIKPTAITGGTQNIFENGHNNANGYELQILSTAKLRIDISFVGSTSSTSNITAGVWTHVAAVRTGSTWQLYINGIADGSTTTSTPNAPGSNTTIGASKNSSGTVSKYFGGDLDDVRFYERALSAQEVLDLYNHGVDINNPDIDSTSLKAWYEMESDVTDSTSNGLDLTATGSPTYTTGKVMLSNPPGITFDSYFYDGVNDFATIPDNDAYSITTTNEFTASVWIKAYTNQFTLSEGSGYVNFLGKSIFDTTNRVEWQFRLYNLSNSETDLRGNESSFYVFNSTGGLGTSSDVRRQLYDVGRWVHWLATVDNTNKIVKLYKDGLLEETVSYSLTISNTDANIYVAHADNNGYFKGEIGPIKIWNRILSNREIQNDMFYRGNTDGLVGHWVADGDNNRLTDLVSSNHGVLSGGPTFRANGCNMHHYLARPRKPFHSQQALSLNGSTQYATITDAAQTGLDIGTGDWLCAGWFWPNTPNGHQVLWAKCDTAHAEPSAPGAVGYEFLYSNNSGIPDIKLLARTDTGNNTSLGTPTFNDNKPHHWAIVFRRSTGRIQIWVDAKYVTGNSPFTGNFDNDGDFRIGVTSGSGLSNYLNGKIWNVHFFKWNAATMPNNQYQNIIEELYQSGTTTYTSNLVSRWFFNGDANDSWGTNHLTLVGSPTYVTLPQRTLVTS